MSSDKGYATVVSLQYVGGPPAPNAVFDLVVVAPDGSLVVEFTGANPLSAAFAYGASSEDIRQAIVQVARLAVGDSSLSVNIIP